MSLAVFVDMFLDASPPARHPPLPCHPVRIRVCDAAESAKVLSCASRAICSLCASAIVFRCQRRCFFFAQLGAGSNPRELLFAVFPMRGVQFLGYVFLELPHRALQSQHANRLARWKRPLADLLGFGIRFVDRARNNKRPQSWFNRSGKAAEASAETAGVSARRRFGNRFAILPLRQRFAGQRFESGGFRRRRLADTPDILSLSGVGRIVADDAYVSFLREVMPAVFPWLARRFGPDRPTASSVPSR